MKERESSRDNARVRARDARALKRPRNPAYRADSSLSRGKELLELTPTPPSDDLLR
jgi:uncharacterized membrane-anchored protein